MTGEELYTMYGDGMSSDVGTEVCPWEELGEKEQTVWNWLAGKLERKDQSTWGIWCVEDRAWCITGTRDEMEAVFPHWASGRAAEVDAKHFHYEMRKKEN